MEETGVDDIVPFPKPERSTQANRFKPLEKAQSGNCLDRQY
jgi:hypothetical protein